MTLPRSRPVQAAVLLLVCGAMAAFPLANHFRHRDACADTAWLADEVAGRAVGGSTANGRNKDYPLWYATGRAFLTGDDYYPPSPDIVYPFMYPPFAGLVLGVLSTLGSDGMLIALVLLNVLAVAVAVELCVRLVAGTGDVPLTARLVPSAICLFFVYDMFLLGQPNLGLLCLVVGGLMLVRSGREVGGGGLLAAATGLKAFPAVVIVYLVWRRHWRAAGAMTAFTAAFVLLLPATVRGWDRSAAELTRWADGMLFKQGDDGFGQRPEQSLGWRNQSLFGVVHRLLRPVNAYADELNVSPEKLAAATGLDVAEVKRIAERVPRRELYVNVLSLDHRQATAGIVLAAGLLGLAFVAVMPARAHRTRTTDAAEFGILAALVILCTPYTFTYYFVWMILPLTVLTWRALTGPTAADRRGGWVWLTAVAVLLALGAPLSDTRLLMALGVQFWAAVVAAAGCGWVILREHSARRSSAGPPAAVGYGRVRTPDGGRQRTASPRLEHPALHQHPQQAS